MRTLERLMVRLLVFLLTTLLTFFIINKYVSAEDLDGSYGNYEWSEIGYILCSPNGEVNIRAGRSTSTEKIGRLFFGDEVKIQKWVTDRYGDKWAYVVNLGTEAGVGFVHGGFIDFTEPSIFEDSSKIGVITCKGRVAVRKGVDCDRKKWVYEGAQIDILAFSDKWVLTNDGYIKSEYITYKNNTEESNHD